MQTLQNSEYKKLADIIHTTLQYGIGDNFNTLKNTLSLIKNNDDLKKLIEAYGFRHNFFYAIPLGKKENLLTNLQHQLSDKKLGIYTDMLNQIRADWAKKKITYKI
jgi:hypothetical protein